MGLGVFDLIYWLPQGKEERIDGDMPFNTACYDSYMIIRQRFSAEYDKQAET